MRESEPERPAATAARLASLACGLWRADVGMLVVSEGLLGRQTSANASS